jgi:hypothetical protein
MPGLVHTRSGYLERALRMCAVCACEVLSLVPFVLSCAETMFALLAMTMLLDANSYVNTINSWAEPHNANGVTPNTVIDSNDEPPCNNQQREIARGY